MSEQAEQLWYRHQYLEPTETGYSLRSADKIWLLVTPAGPEYRDEASYFHLSRWDEEGAEAPWVAAFDPMEGTTPIFISLRDAKEFLEGRGDLPHCEWMPVTQGDLWRSSEYGRCRRKTSEKTLAAIKAANNPKETTK